MRRIPGSHNCILQGCALQPEAADLWVLVPAILAGLLTHGVMLVNKFSFHDDIYQLFAPGQTFIAGRWFLGLIAWFESRLFGTTTLSLPLFNGLLCISLLGIAAVVLARLYELQGRTTRILAGCAMTIMPSVVSMMGFMFTAHYYALGFLLASVGASLMVRMRSRLEILAGIGCVVLALGIYQAALPLVCAVMVLYDMQEVLRTNPSGRQFLIRAGHYILEVAAAVAVYGVLAVIGMRTLGGSASATDYAGLSSVGHTGIGIYLRRILLAYREFCLPTRDAIYNQYPASIRMMYIVLLLLIALLIARRVVLTIRGGHASSAAQYILLTILLPLCMNLVFVMTDVMWVHAITVYAQVLLFYLLAVECEAITRYQHAATLENMAGEHEVEPAHHTSDAVREPEAVPVTFADCCAPSVILSAVALAAAALMVIAYIRYGNLCYLKAQFLTAEATSYYDRLITRIQSMEGYAPDMPIVFLNEQDKQADSLYDMEEFQAVITSPYNYNTIINDYAWKEYMRYYNNYDPIVYPESKDGELPEEIRAMPRYPADGSIQIFAPGYIVVKF